MVHRFNIQSKDQGKNSPVPPPPPPPPPNPPAALAVVMVIISIYYVSIYLHNLPLQYYYVTGHFWEMIFLVLIQYIGGCFIQCTCVILSLEESKVGRRWPLLNLQYIYVN